MRVAHLRVLDADGHTSSARPPPGLCISKVRELIVGTQSHERRCGRWNFQRQASAHVDRVLQLMQMIFRTKARQPIALTLTPPPSAHFAHRTSPPRLTAERRFFSAARGTYLLTLPYLMKACQDQKVAGFPPPTKRGNLDWVSLPFYSPRFQKMGLRRSYLLTL